MPVCVLCTSTHSVYGSWHSFQGTMPSCREKMVAAFAGGAASAVIVSATSQAALLSANGIPFAHRDAPE